MLCSIKCKYCCCRLSVCLFVVSNFLLFHVSLCFGQSFFNIILLFIPSHVFCTFVKNQELIGNFGDKKTITNYVVQDITLPTSPTSVQKRYGKDSPIAGWPLWAVDIRGPLAQCIFSS